VGPLLVRIKRLEERRRRERSVVDLVDFSRFAGKNALVVATNELWVGIIFVTADPLLNLRHSSNDLTKTGG
jgi:hypothetical protein